MLLTTHSYFPADEKKHVGRIKNPQILIFFQTIEFSSTPKRIQTLNLWFQFQSGTIKGWIEN